MPVEVDFLSELKRHTAPVNVARFSPSGRYIASAGDGKYDDIRIVLAIIPRLTLFQRYQYYNMETYRCQANNIRKREC
jgi:chromatin assembly factor 1 subunit B